MLKTEQGFGQSFFFAEMVKFQKLNSLDKKKLIQNEFTILEQIFEAICSDE